MRMPVASSSPPLTVLCHSLCKGVVVYVAFWCRFGEEVDCGHQAGMRRRLGLVLRELEGPQVGHLLGLHVRRLLGERLHTITKQTVRALQTHTGKR